MKRKTQQQHLSNKIHHYASILSSKQLEAVVSFVLQNKLQ